MEILIYQINPLIKLLICSIVNIALTPPANTVIQGYVILINDGLGGDTYSIGYNGKLDSGQLTASITGLSARRTYQIVGYAINKAGNGPQSSVVTCYTVAPPGQPGRPTYISSTTSSIYVEWEPAFEDGGSPITEYQLYYDLVEGEGTAGVANWIMAVNSNVLQYNVTGLTANSLYRFEVLAKSGSIVAGDYSPISQFYAMPLPSQIVINTASTEFLGSSIKLHWTIQSGIIGYRVYYNQGYKTYGFTLLEDIPNSDLNEYTASKLTVGMQYGFTVSAYNEAGEGPQSDAYYLIAMSKPGAPTSLIRTGSTDNGDSTSNIMLSWTPPDNTGFVPLTGYKLYMLNVSASTTSVVYDGSSSAAITSATISGLVLGNNYEFWVTALNPLESDQSNTTTLTAAALPSAPGAISVITRTSNSLQLSWIATAVNGGSSILAYTLVEDTWNEAKGSIDTKVVYFGISNTVSIEGMAFYIC